MRRPNGRRSAFMVHHASRRRVVHAGALLGVSSLAEVLGLHAAQASPASDDRPSPYGALRPARDLATGLPLLQLPPGFRYRSYTWTGDALDDGTPCPGNHDGMAVLASRSGAHDGELVLVRNHERGEVPDPIAAPAQYDRAQTEGKRPGGGTTTLRFRGREFVGARQSLGGTLWNCAGGPTPWGTWLTCEETLADLTARGGRRHGYVFEVRADPRATTGTPLVAMGRFAHEAVAIDPRTHYAYLTEDYRNASALYRFIPADRSGTPGAYEKGGRLQAARVIGQPNADLRAPTAGATLSLEWIDIADPDASPVRVNQPEGGPQVPEAAGRGGEVSGPFWQAWNRGALRMARGEGIWQRDGVLYVVDTSAGADAAGRRGYGRGAVWQLDPRNDTLRALFVPASTQEALNPDNVTVSPRGGILLCEDADGAPQQAALGTRLIGLTARGVPYAFARNNVMLDEAQLRSAGKQVAPRDYRAGEFAGACFDSRGRVLFVNVQWPGITFAIWGPWARGPL